MPSTSSSKGVWPDEMIILVDEKDPVLLELLFAREYWKLVAGSAVPGLSVVPSDYALTPIYSGSDTRWEGDWSDRMSRLAHGDSRPDSATLGNPEAFAKWCVSQPKRWSESFLEIWPDDIYVDWLERVLRPSRGISFAQNPEHLSTDGVRLAWENGLRRIVVLPLKEQFGMRVGRDTLVVSTRSRNDPTSYRLALAGGS